MTSADTRSAKPLKRKACRREVKAILDILDADIERARAIGSAASARAIVLLRQSHQKRLSLCVMCGGCKMARKAVKRLPRLP